MTANAHILLTGATGFVGKVVLEQLVRRSAELGVASVTLIVRVPPDAKDRQAAAQLRLDKIVASPLFAGQPAGWSSMVSVVAGDLEQHGCGLAAADRAAVLARTTHVIHCAASVEFDLPLPEAAAANVTTALEVLELARACPRLVRMVSVSTAYVSTWRPGPIEERLAFLPAPAEELLARARSGRVPDAVMLGETGHPNTYTLTKCLAEHMLVARRGDVPLAIVRPSIVSATWRAPFVGWIDSTAALAGCLLYAGLGVVRAWKANPGARLDVVPVDVVGDEILAAAFAQEAGAFSIRHATMGIENALRVDLATESTLRFFRARPGAKRVPGMFLGTAEDGFGRVDLLRRELPTQAARLALALTGRTKARKRLEKVDRQVRHLNSAFEYFAHHTFDFRRPEPRVLAGYSPAAYLDVVLRGLYAHLLRKDETELSFAGAAHEDPRTDLQWAREPGRDGNATMRALGVGLRAALRKSASAVTFDRASFERALAAAPADAMIILAPSHRSYLDFLVMSYLCFQHPELGIAVPHIAAAEEFGKIPVVGKILTASRAFYLRRGAGQESPEVAAELRRIAARDASLMFFVEGQRSRSRAFLAPKRGLLRGLQATGKTFAVLPIGLTYDRLPEERALEHELGGGARPTMRLQPLLKWIGRLARGQVSLGRVHVACGELQVLAPTTDVPTLARAMVAEQQRTTAVTSFHLRSFLAEAGLDPALGVDEAWLADAIRARGGRVLASDLPVPALTPTLAQSLRNQWTHWFYGDALTRFPDNLAIEDHVRRNAWHPATPVAEVDDRTAAVVDALMAPIALAYQVAAARFAEPLPDSAALRPVDLVRAHPAVHLPHVEDAFRSLAEREVVKPVDGGYAWAEHPAAASLLAGYVGRGAGVAS